MMLQHLLTKKSTELTPRYEMMIHIQMFTERGSINEKTPDKEEEE